MLIFITAAIEDISQTFINIQEYLKATYQSTDDFDAKISETAEQSAMKIMKEISPFLTTRDEQKEEIRLFSVDGEALPVVEDFTIQLKYIAYRLLKAMSELLKHESLPEIVWPETRIRNGMNI